MKLDKAKQILNEAGFKYVDAETELKRKEKFKKDLIQYMEAAKDVQTAIKESLEGLNQTMTDEMEDYVVNESRFILKMSKRLMKLIENDLYKTIREED